MLAPAVRYVALLLALVATPLALVLAPQDGPPRTVRGGLAATPPSGRPEAVCLAAPDPACLVELAVAASLSASDEDRLLPALAGALARAGRLDAAEAIRQRLRGEGAAGRDGARREEAADRILVAELLWAARHDPAHPADLGALDELAERPRRGLDGPARRAEALAELAGLLCRDHARGLRGAAAMPGDPGGPAGDGAPAARRLNATFAALLARWPAAIEARPARRQPSDWEALAEAHACAGDPGAARAALRRAALAAPGTAHPGRVRALLALGETGEAEATALDLRRPDQRAAGLLAVAWHAAEEGRRERAAELADLAVEAAMGGRLPVLERLRVLRGVARLRHGPLGDPQGARDAAEAVQAAVTEPPDATPRPLHLIEAAGAFNDIGHGEPACRLAAAALEAAAAPAPARGPSAGGAAGGSAPDGAPSAPATRLFGLRVLPQLGSAQERLPAIGDALRARIAVELHRCGRQEAALRLLRETAAQHRANGWIELHKAALAAGTAEPTPPGRLPDLVAPDQRGRTAAALAEFHAARGEAGPATAWIAAALEAGTGGPALAEAAARIGRRDLATQALKRIAPSQLRGPPAQRAMDLLALAARFEELRGEEGTAAAAGR
ncbi:hypothetical protein GCM10010964_22070 [Caldovatus sediminis]|uniref:Uncharacterized protein n=1 Tax=Caldovatus sediminis TaxID=2041189 RepID=A0A8J3ECE7_9PROT|nr:hypothetical protein [Caldovatus sediminis]GGG33740.1 hypothetical protein GCM10010964_22070 [Caldovatus sediminis]